MKKFLLTLLAIGFAASINAGILSTNITVAGTNLLVSGSVYVAGLIAVNNSTNGQTLTFYDNNAAANTYTNAAYASIASYTTNMVQGTFTGTNNSMYTGPYISYSGLTNYITNSYTYTYLVTNSASSTLALPALLSLYLPGNTTTQLRDLGLNCGLGLVSVNTSSNCQVIMYYQTR